MGRQKIIQKKDGGWRGGRESHNIAAVNKALSWSCKLYSPISSRLSFGYLLAFRCESVDACAQLHPPFQCAMTVQVVGREPIHSGTNLFHCYQHISATAPMHLRRIWAKDAGRPQQLKIYTVQTKPAEKIFYAQGLKQTCPNLQAQMEMIGLNNFNLCPLSFVRAMLLTAT